MVEHLGSVFEITATTPAARPRVVLKHGDMFAVLDDHGAIGASAGGPDGIFLNDTRHLSAFELLIGGVQPLLLGSDVRDNNLTLEVDLTNPDIYANDKLVLRKDTLHIHKSFFIYDKRAFFRVRLHNYSADTIELPLALTFAADFSDLFEVRGTRRKRHGTVDGHYRAAAAIFTYRALDGVETATTLHFDPAPDDIRNQAAIYRLRLAGGERRSFFATIASGQNDDDPRAPFLRNLVSVWREERRTRKSLTSLSSSSEGLSGVLERSLDDLNMLITDTDQGPYPYAGIPWYSTTFGRDGLITALQMLWCQPDLAKGVLKRLAFLQATTDDPSNDAQPGKIIHEMRGGEMARLREVPFGRYYGSVDSTPLFVLLAARYWQRTRDRATLETLWPNIERALQWIDGPGDQDKDGFVEYQRATEDGLQNQGWKDSYDSIFHQNGELACGPIALAEVQAYVHAAKAGLAACAEAIGKSGVAERLRKEAADLFRRFNTAFWCDDIGTYAIALDGEKEPCRIRSSNAGHVLLGRLATRERADRTRQLMASADMMSGWGVRTIARGESRYNPMSYHNGSVWPHDTALVTMGLREYGFVAEVQQIAGAVMAAAGAMDHCQLPELYCGFVRTPGRGPTLYPVACAPQAWASAAPFALLAALLGISIDAGSRRIELWEPRLPDGCRRVAIRNLPIADTTIDLAVSGERDRPSVEILNEPRGIDVSIRIAE